MLESESGMWRDLPFSPALPFSLTYYFIFLKTWLLFCHFVIIFSAVLEPRLFF